MRLSMMLVGFMLATTIATGARASDPKAAREMEVRGRESLYTGLVLTFSGAGLMAAGTITAFERVDSDVSAALIGSGFFAALLGTPLVVLGENQLAEARSLRSQSVSPFVAPIRGGGIAGLTVLAF